MIRVWLTQKFVAEFQCDKCFRSWKEDAPADGMIYLPAVCPNCSKEEKEAL